MVPGAHAVALAAEALARRAFVKVIAGIAATDGGRARNLAFVYTLAGAHAIDVACAPAVVEATRAGIAEALAFAARRGRALSPPLLMVSVGLDRDPHVAAPLLDRALCLSCAVCAITELRACAERPLEARAHECRTCGRCVGACPLGAIRLAPPTALSVPDLEAARAAGAEAVELHVSGVEPDDVLAAWRGARAVFGDGAPVSFSLGSRVSSHDFVERQVEAIESVGAPFVILQAEGTPSSGRTDALGAGDEVRPSIELAERVLRVRRRGFVQVSGGADEHTGPLLRSLGLAVDGVAFGSAARALCAEALRQPTLDESTPALGPALAAACRLVASVAPPEPLEGAAPWTSKTSSARR